MLKNHTAVQEIKLNKRTLFGNTITPVLLNTDALSGLRKLPRALVDVAVTSPPYWGQRDYGHTNEIGKEETSEQYVQSLLEINNELKRVLKDTGVYFLNIGDKYRDKGLEMIPERVALGMRNNGWVVRNKIIWHKKNPNPSPISDRFTNAYEVIFMFVKGTDNYLRPEYYFDLDAIRIPHTSNGKNGKNEHLPRTIKLDEFQHYSKLIQNVEYNGKFKNESIKNRGASAGGRVGTNGEYYSRQRKHPISHELKNEIITFLRGAREDTDISIEEIDKQMDTSHTAGHWFRLDRGGSSLPNPEQWNKLKKILGIGKTKFDQIVTEEHYVLQTVRPHEKGKNPSDVWTMSTARIKEKHFAPFPEELPEICIKSCCPKDGIVLDPFAGSGTALKVAHRLKRKSIGIEIKYQYLSIIKRIVDTNINVLKL